MKQQLWSMIRLFGILAILAGSTMPAALAEPEVAVLADSPTLPLAELGADNNLAFYGQIGTATLSVPVPAGMTPASLNVLTQLPVNVRSGTLTVTQEDRAIAQVDIPPTSAPVVIPLAGAKVVDNAVSVLLRSYLLPLDGYCLDPTNPLRLTDASVSFAGAETAPRVVADFLPPVLRKLVIYIGSRPSRVESDAAVQLATSIVAHYGKQAPIVEVAALAAPNQPPPGDGVPLERHIVIAEGPDASVSLYGNSGVPALLITGPAGELTNQTRLLTSGLVRYSLASKAVVGPLKTAPQLTADETTIRKLGQPGVNAVALNPQVGIALDQTRLGRASHNIRVHLQGSYTPLPDSVGGQIVASIAGETVDRWSADATGVIDRWVNIPDRLLARYTTLAVQVNISGNTGRCGEFQPITLTIDGESVVTSEPATPPVPAGFQSMPQALMPRVLVGINSDAFGDTVRAVQIMTGLQKLSALPVDTDVVSVQEAINSANPAVLVSPDGWDNDKIHLPVFAPGAVPMTLNAFDDAGAATTLTLDPSLRFASLQTVVDGNRSILVATSNGAPGQLDELLRWLGQDVQRWSNVNGVALISVADRDPITVTAPDAIAAPEEVKQASSPLRWWALIGIVLAGVAIATSVLLTRERRRAKGG